MRPCPSAWGQRISWRQPIQRRWASQKTTGQARRGRLYTAPAILSTLRMSAFIHCCLSLRVVRAAVRNRKLPRRRSVLQRVRSSAAGCRIHAPGHEAGIGMPVSALAAMTVVESEAAGQVAWQPLPAPTLRRTQTFERQWTRLRDDAHSHS